VVVVAEERQNIPFAVQFISRPALIRLLRQERSLTQDQLGSSLGVDRRRISQIESHPDVTSFNQRSPIITILGGRLHVESTTDDRPEIPS
jgi:DNA-binding XRE family transcriptional regulator